MSMSKHILLATAALTIAVPVHAQTSPGPGAVAENPEAEEQGWDSQEIIVTARKRAESILETPVSVTALSGERIDDYGFGTVSQLATITPNLYIDEAPTSARISIRGLGTTGTAASFDQSVGLSIDGLFFGRARWFEVGLFDTEQVEVLRGPQGVYFGKNTTAGLVNIQTRGPGESWEGHVRGGYEFLQREFLLEGAVSGPLSDTVGVRVAAQMRSRDGYYRNLDLDRREVGLDQILARLTLDWRPSETVSFVYKGQYAKADQDGQLNQMSICTPGLLGLLAAFGSREDCVLDRKRTAGRPVNGFNRRLDSLENDSWSQSLTANVELGDFALTSVTGFHYQDVITFPDSDFTDLQLLHLSIAERYKQFSQEVRIRSPEGKLVEVNAGAYYERSNLDTTLVIDYNLGAYLPLPLFGTGLRNYVQKGDSWALFGELTLNITDALRLTAGGRYTHERKRVRGTQDLGPLGSPFVNDPAAFAAFGLIGWTEIDVTDKRSENDFSPAVSLQWDIADNVHSYVSYKQGFKSGGFDSNVSRQLADGSVPNFEYEDEGAKGVEAGLKFSAVDNRLRISTAAFRTTYSNLQVAAYLGLGLVATRNAATVRSQGVEVEASFRAADNFNLHASLGYTDAKYRSFPNAPCFTLQTVAQGCVNSQQDLSGEQLVLAPKVQSTIGFNSFHDLGSNLRLHLGTDVNYRDKVWLQLDHHPTSLEKSLWLTNARVALSDQDERWMLAVIAQNLFNENYRVGSVPNGFFAGSFASLSGTPRTVFLQGTYKF